MKESKSASEMRERMMRGLFGEEFYRSGKFSNIRTEWEIPIDDLDDGDMKILQGLVRRMKGRLILRVGP